MSWSFVYVKTENSGSLGWDEPVSMFSTVAILLILFCVSIVTGLSEWVLKNFSVISWIVMLLFVGVGIFEARTVHARSNPVLSILCMLLSQGSFGFYILLTLRDLALVGRDGLAGLIGVVILAPIYALGLTICHIPNQVGCDYRDETWAPIQDALLTPALIALACKLCGFYDSVPRVWHALFGA